MQSYNPYDQYIALHAIALKALAESKAEAECALRKPRTIIQLHYLVMAIIFYLIGIVALVPWIRQLLNQWGFPDSARGASYLVALAIWTVAIAPTSGMLYTRIQHRSWALLLYSVLVLPLLIAIVEQVLRHGFVQFQLSLLALPMYSLIFLVPVGVICITVSGSIPMSLFLLATSFRAGKAGDVFPSFETMLRDISERLHPALRSYSADERTQIALIAQQKQTSINGRIQTIALAAASIALLSLLSLVIDQQQIVQGIASFVKYVNGLFGAPTTEQLSIDSTGFTVAIVLLLAFVVFSYAMRTYRELRLLDAIVLACAMEPQPVPQAAHLSAAQVQPPLPTAVKRETPMLLWPLLSSIALLLLLILRELQGLQDRDKR
jgi:hypothetical protein